MKDAVQVADVANLTVTEEAVPQVTLVVPSTGDAAQLTGFFHQVREKLQAKIVGIVGSWTDTRITLQPPPGTQTDICSELLKISLVEEAKENDPKGVQSLNKEVWVTLRAASHSDYAEVA